VALLQQQHLAVALELQRRNIGLQGMTASLCSTRNNEVITMTSESSVSNELSSKISATERRVSASPVLVMERYGPAGSSKQLKAVRRCVYGSKREEGATDKSLLMHPAIASTSSSRRMQKCAPNSFLVGSNKQTNVSSDSTGCSPPTFRNSYSLMQEGSFPLDDMRRLISNCTTTSNDRILPALTTTTSDVRSIATVTVAAIQCADAKTFAEESRTVSAIDSDKLACDTDNVSGTVQKLVDCARLSVPSVIPPLSPVVVDPWNVMSPVTAQPL
jgi:hypothetical protein